MKNLILMFVIACSFVVTPLRVAQQKEEPKFKLVQFHMALIRKGLRWTAEKTKETTQLHEQHFAYVVSLLESGKAIIAGPLADESGILGILIFRAQSAEEAKTWAEADPAVKAGRFLAEMHPWWSEDIFKKPNSPLKLINVYLAFLTRGSNRTQQPSEAEEIQKAHIANIERLAKLGKIVAAGPFGDDGNLRGILVFRVTSLEEAQALAATDPAVKAGRLAIELHPWQVPEGVLP